ncbi:HemK2/MTQ2 family protein methyltransferase [Nanoarchaeota archaeon]
MDPLYEPREDSFLLQKEVSKYATGDVLDIGTGTGVQAFEALKQKRVKSVIGVDLNPEAIKYCKKEKNNLRTKKEISFLKSDLFSKLKNKKFDTIIFNPPYLPADPKYPDKALDGGKKGYEIIERFIEDSNPHLNEKGIVLVLFSSLTKKDKVEEIIDNYGFKFEKLSSLKISFEELYVYKITKSEELKILNKHKIKNIKKFMKGHRGMIFTGDKNKEKLAAKFQRKDIQARNTVNNEIEKLKLLNKQDIGPKLIISGKDYFIYEFVPGEFVLQYFEKADKKEIKRIILDVMKQMKILDDLGMNKQEMQHPHKHIICNKGKKPVLVDFERCKYSEKVHNVTQFCQFISSLSKDLLKRKGFKIKPEDVLKKAKYYASIDKESGFKDIMALLKQG